VKEVERKEIERGQEPVMICGSVMREKRTGGKDIKPSGHGSFTVKEREKGKGKERKGINISALELLLLHAPVYMHACTRAKRVVFQTWTTFICIHEENLFPTARFSTETDDGIHTRGPHVLSLLCQSPCALIYFTLCHCRKKRCSILAP
jgi:hypothetical protein